MRSLPLRLAILLAGGAWILSPAWSDRAHAIDTETQSFEPPAQQSPSTDKPAIKSTDEKGAPKSKDEKAKDEKTKDEKKSEWQFLDGYRAAHAAIYQRHDYAAGIRQLKSLGHDDHPDVANLIGYSNRKLGRYDDAKLWYERALAADPRHVQTWSYYGMWQVEQGDIFRAREFLARVEALCGTKCRAYTELQAVIEGTLDY